MHENNLGRQQAERIAKNLRRSLDDRNDLVIEVVKTARIFGQDIWSIQIGVPGGITLVYSPMLLDNGAEGIHEEYLIAIRRAAGEDLPNPNRSTRTDPYKYFFDIMSVDKPGNPDDSH